MKYQESGNLNIAETRRTIAETQRLTRVSVSRYVMVSHVSVAVFSVSGITYFRNRYHVNKLQGCEITFGNKFVSFSSFGGSVELRSGYVPFFLFSSISFVLTMSTSLKNYLHTQMVIFLVVIIYKFNLHESLIQLSSEQVFISRLQAVCLYARKRRRCEP